MWQQIVTAGLDVGCVREHAYVSGRKFRADFAWPAPHRLLLEVQGGVFSGKSGHSGIAGILRDCDRANARSRQCRYARTARRVGVCSRWRRGDGIRCGKTLPVRCQR